jgi:hypothetical protein
MRYLRDMVEDIVARTEINRRFIPLSKSAQRILATGFVIFCVLGLLIRLAGR